MPPVTPGDDLLDRYYSEHYASVVHSGAGGVVQRAFHQAVEHPWQARYRFENVLELGATAGEHLAFVRHRFSRYTMLDIRDSSEARAVAAAADRGEGAVEFILGDAQSLDGIDDGSVDRLISMCLLHHLEDPRGALRQWRRVVKPGGVISIFVPCDPGSLWRAGRSITTFRAARANGYSSLEIRYINACDHRNHVGSIAAMIEGTFAADEVHARRYPFNWLPSWNANLFMTFQINRGPTGEPARI